MSLVSADVSSFEAAARARVAGLAEEGYKAEALTQLFVELEASALPGRESARRATRIAELLPPGAAGPLAAAITASGKVIRTALVGRVPPDLRQGIYSAQPQVPPTMNSRSVSEAPAEEQVPVPDQPEEPEQWDSVLLLGGAIEVAANARLLAAHNFKGIRAANLEELASLSQEPICGVVVYGSWWRQFDGPEAIVNFVKRRIAESNALCLKLDYSHLEDAAERLAAVVETLDDEVRARVSGAHGAELTAADILSLRRVATSLRTADQAAVEVAGVDMQERRLLATAVAAFARAKHLPCFASAETLSITPIEEGRSGARVLAVKSKAYRLMVVAKLDELAALEDEIERARQAIPAIWPSADQMYLCSLAAKGVLLQRLFLGLDDHDVVAPSLRALLRSCAAWEFGRQGIAEPRSELILEGIDRLCARVVELNRSADAEPPSTGWTGTETITALAEHGIRWTLAGAAGAFDPAEHIPRAQEILSEDLPTRVLHGDLHAANLLMTDDRTPELIDFASAGSGHPCFDLVRISSAITYEFLRDLSGESELCSFFTRIHVDLAAENELRCEFPSLVGSVGARVALHALVVCRDAGLGQLLGVTENRHRHYLAMVYLIGVQSLTIEGFQEGVVRAALAAVGPALVH